MRVRGLIDDIGKPSIGVNEAQAANIKLSHMFKEKGLEAHPDKTCFVVFGSPEYKDKITEQLKVNPLSLGDFPVKRKGSLSWTNSPHRWCSG